MTAAKQALESRAQQDAMRDALLASFSHDMRTPLTTVTSAISGLASEPGSANALAAAQAGASRLEWLFANLADLARIRAGAVALKLEAIDLTDAIDAALEAMKTEIGARKVQLDFPDAMPLVRSDSRLLHHILVNLLDNACKYGDSNGPIDIEVRCDTRALVLAVNDRGPGFGDLDETRLFEAYARGSSLDTTPGQGLGLAIVAGFAKALEIDVSAANRAGGTGASFELRFPPELIVAADMGTVR